MSTPEIIGNLIKNKRNEMNISQGKLAKKLDVQPPVIYKYEKGIIKIIPMEKRSIISKALNIPIKDLLYENEISGYEAGYKRAQDVVNKVLAAVFLTPTNVGIEKIKEKIQEDFPSIFEYDFSKSIDYLLEIRKILLKNQKLDVNDKKKLEEYSSLYLDSLPSMFLNEITTTAKK